MFLSFSDITKKHAADTGMAVVLLCLLFGNIFIKINTLNLVAIVALIITMSIPILFKPLAVLWFGLSHVLGTIVSKILLSAIFFVFVTPIGKLVNLFRNDPMRLKEFKRSNESVFHAKQHLFTKQDLEHPF